MSLTFKNKPYGSLVGSGNLQFRHYGSESGFYALSLDGSIYKSTDGLTWNSFSTLPSGTYASMCYGDGKFVCLGVKGTSYYSTDGVTWTAMSGLYNTTYTSVTYGNNKNFVCVGYGGYSYYCDHTMMWRQLKGGSSGNYFGVTYGNNKYLAVGKTALCIVETLPQDWKNNIGTISGTFNDAAYNDNNKRFLAVGEYVAYYSADGTTWSSANLPSQVSLKSITTNGNIYVSVGASGKSYVTDAAQMQWAELTGLNSTVYNSVTCGNGKFVCVGYGGESYYLSNSTWISMTGLDSSKTYVAVIYV